MGVCPRSCRNPFSLGLAVSRWCFAHVLVVFRSCFGGVLVLFRWRVGHVSCPALVKTE